MMLDHEQPVMWLVILGIAATLLLSRVTGKRSERNRRLWFESVATAFGARAEHVSEFLSRFAAEVDGRTCEVSHRYGRRVGWRLVGSIALNGVSDIYCLVLHASDDPADGGLRIRNNGFTPHEGWLNADVRPAVLHFFEIAPRKTALDVEGGSLMCHADDRVEGSVFRSRIAQLVPVARALERTL